MKVDDEWLQITETPAGGLLDPEVMEQLLAEWMQGLWYWHDDEAAQLYRDLPK